MDTPTMVRLQTYGIVENNYHICSKIVTMITLLRVLKIFHDYVKYFMHNTSSQLPILGT